MINPINSNLLSFICFEDYISPSITLVDQIFFKCFMFSNEKNKSVRKLNPIRNFDCIILKKINGLSFLSGHNGS